MFNKILLFIITIVLSGQVVIADDSMIGRSAASLVNPPSPKIVWEFWGGQVIHVSVGNGNILGATVEVVCAQYYNEAPWHFILAPNQQVRRDYGCFDYHPIHWLFNVATFSDAAMILVEASWTKAIPDRPGYPNDEYV